MPPGYTDDAVFRRAHASPNFLASTLQLFVRFMVVRRCEAYRAHSRSIFLAPSLAVLPYWVGIESSQVYRTEKQAYSNTQLSEDEFDAQESAPQGREGLTHLVLRLRISYLSTYGTVPSPVVGLPTPHETWKGLLSNVRAWSLLRISASLLRLGGPCELLPLRFSSRRADSRPHIG